MIDDIDFFAFPAVNDEHGQDAVEAPIDGFMMAAEPANEEGAKALLSGLGHVSRPSTRTSASTRRWSPPTQRPTRVATTALQQRSVELVDAATYIAQFLDRDTDPDFAANVVGTALADFIADPSQIDSILGTSRSRSRPTTFE